MRIKLTYSGDFGETNSSLIRNAALTGVLNRFLDEKANLINAAGVAKERGLGVSENRRGRTQFSDTVGVLVETDKGQYDVEGAVFPDGSARLISVNGIYVEGPLSDHMLFVQNDDTPGVIGKVGTTLGEHGVNIADFSLGRDKKNGAEAVAVVRVDSEIPEAALKQLTDVQAIRTALPVNF